MRQLCSVLWLLCLAGAASMVMAQDLVVSGKVTIENSGDPLPGVTIIVKGSTLSTVTGAEGEYSLTIPGAKEALLEFSFIGFKPVEQSVSGSNSSLNVTMAEAPLEIQEEMVITGFTTSVKRKNLANAVASINEEEISRVSSPTVDGAISAKFPGVTVSANSGAPGGGFSVNLRGISTINGSSTPLYVVDGVIFSNTEIQSGVNAVTAAAGAGNAGNQDQPSNRVADLIPSDIASIEILKGPSAAALYGSKASNGVIVISTKKGKAGKPQYNFSQTIGSRSIIKKLGTRKFTRETAIATYGAAGEQYFTDNFYDHEEETYGHEGAILESNFSTRGGNEKTRYYFSGYALDDEGIVENTGYDKTGVRMNLDHNFTARLNASLNLGFVRSRARRGLTGNDNAGTTYGVALSSTPSFYDIRAQDGVFSSNAFASSNPLQTIALMKNEETINRTTATLKLDYNLYESAKQALDINVTAGLDFFSMETDARFPNELQFEADSTMPGTSILGETESSNDNVYINLTHTLYAGNNTFRTTGGVQYENRDLNYINAVGSGLIEGQFNLDNAASLLFQQTRVLQRDRGFFIQEEVNLGEAVLLTAGVRGDSSSVNGEEDKFYTYPKASASVRLSEYDFWQSVENVMTEFKLRVAWGQTGNLPIPTAKFSGFNSVNNGGLGGLLPAALRGNPNIKPETSEELEFGFDVTFYDGKATLEVTSFKQEISDLLLFRRLPPSTGFTRESVNGGEMEVDGTEIALRMNPIRKDDFNWTFGLNYYTYEGLVTKLVIPAYNTGGFAAFLGQFRIEEGWSPTSIIGSDTLPDGSLEKLGDETPDYQMGWDNELRYKDWTLTWLLDLKEGGEVINLTKLLTDLGGTTADLDEDGGSRLSSLGTTTKPWIEDGSYVRLREIKLQYSLGASRLKNIAYGKLDHVDFSISGRNLKTWTDYSSYDPEVSNFGTIAIGRSVEVTPFPSSKSWYFNVSVGL